MKESLAFAITLLPVPASATGAKAVAQKQPTAGIVAGALILRAIRLLWPLMPAVSIGEIVDYVNGRYTGPRDRHVVGFAPLSQATSEHISFFSNLRYAPQLRTTNAGAVLVPQDITGDDARWVRVDDPYFALARVATRWFDQRPRPSGISPHASIMPSAKLGRNVAVGAFATIGENVVIGDDVSIFQHVSIEVGANIGNNTIIYPNVVIYDGTQIGARCTIHAGAIIGSDGFGFATHDGEHHKIPQLGIVRIGNDVEIGAGTTIDRAAFGETVIGDGTKIDNLVQVGHNVKVGKYCLLVAQAGIAGSAKLGDRVTMAGQSGVSGHITVADGAEIAGQAGVTNNIPEGLRVAGTPALPFRQFARVQVALKRIIQKKE
jgi:UDP-3-O-[3-hydroxymyristoyl] glucosamine N-acyltransferase